jgi:mono/diheme cytochrome c family protein
MLQRVAWVVVLLVLAAPVAAFAYFISGSYNVAADEAHWAVTSGLLEEVRERSIKTRASGIPVPDLTSEESIATGASHYAEMCVECHLAPGVADTELRRGLNPEPPELTLMHELDPAEAFWVIKHGVKMSGMPAWGRTHDDETIWAMVAFLQRLPGLSADEFEGIATAGGDHDHDAHDHEAADHGSPADAQMPDESSPAAPAEGTVHVHASGEVHRH